MRYALAGLFALLTATAARADDVEPPLGTRIADFRAARAADGTEWSLAKQTRGAKAVVVLFLGTECPIGNAYLPALVELHSEYARRGVAFVALNANSQDDAATIARHAKDHDLPFPVLKDDAAAVADRFRADRVPAAFVLDGERVVRYRGRIDDRFGRGVKRAAPTRHDLRDALDAVLGGRAVARPTTEVVGCPISRPSRAAKPAGRGGKPVTYAKHVAAILQKNCQGCHRPGEVGPFKLMNYRDAVAWADAIDEAVAERRMPPWSADPAHGHFANDRRLSEADRETLAAWVAQGCPEGDAADLPPPVKYVEGWSIGKPDEVLAMADNVPVPAQTPPGGIPYKYVLVGPPFAEEKWVRAAEVRPGNRGVVHHIIVYVLKPGQKLSMLSSNGFGDLFGSLTGREQPESLVSFVPGDQAFRLPADQAKRIPKGARLAFEIHYTPNGRAGADRSSIGLSYAARPPRHEVRAEAVINWSFSIPPHAADYRVTASHTFQRDAVLLSMSPHMHLRGKSFEFRLTSPGGKPEVLLAVPKYDFNWQHNYILAEPRRVAKGAKLSCVARYDNSAGNPNNPDPSKRVVWGNQTWDEMMLGSFDYYEAR